MMNASLRLEPYLKGTDGAAGAAGSQTKLTASGSIAWDSTMSLGKLCSSNAADLGL